MLVVGGWPEGPEERGSFNGQPLECNGRVTNHITNHTKYSTYLTPSLVLAISNYCKKMAGVHQMSFRLTHTSIKAEKSHNILQVLYILSIVRWICGEK
jgi:hypothetical protein